MSILAYITDLSFQARISQTAQAEAVEVKVVSSLYHFLPGLEKKPSMVLIGLAPLQVLVQILQGFETAWSALPLYHRQP